MAFNSTIGDPAANSFASVPEAIAYHEGRLFNEEWINASTIKRQSALMWATRLLDALSWEGQKTASSQALKWPRTYVYDDNGDQLDTATIPQFLIDATAEYALQLIKSDRESDSDTQGISEVKAGEVEVVFDKTDRGSKTPSSVYRLINQYVTGSGSGSFTYVTRA